MKEVNGTPHVCGSGKRMVMIRNDFNVVEKEDQNEETKNPASFINAIHHRNLLIPCYNH